MDTLSLLSLLLITACFAAPHIRGANVPNSALPSIPTSFKQPSTAPVFVALITGFYDYTCSKDGSWKFSGSSGSAFDISGLFDSGEFTNIGFDAFNDMSNSHSSDPFDPSFAARIESKYGIKLLGEYSDTVGSTGSSSPKVDFSSTGGGSVVTAVTADAKSPSNSSSAVDWLQLKATSGSLAQTVLLIGTVGGQAPNESCEPGTPDATTQFCAQLWGF